MNKFHTVGRKLLAVLAAAAVPLTGVFSSAPLVQAAGNESTSTKTSSVLNAGQTGNTTIEGRSISKASNGYLDYTYTGNIFTAKSSLYDYRSDNEIKGETIYSTASGYTDPYTILNRAISQQVISSSSENLTIMYESDQASNNDIKVQLFGEGKNNGSPGAAMTYDSSLGKYVYTVKYDDIGFVPDQFIINGNGNSWHTNTVYKTLEKGKSYSFYKDNITEGTALALTSDTCPYEVPLYFGCFYLGDYGSNYNGGNKAAYSNFYWQANISQRADTSHNNIINFDSSVQGLVDNTLKDGTISQNGVTLPYFSDDWADNHPGLVKYWHDIDFPFYEINVDASKVYGDGVGTAKYYQFNSKEGDKYSLYFQPDDAKKTGTYQETTTAIKSQSTTTHDDGTISYLPFNKENDSPRNNLGFGMTFEMSFQIRSDGKVDTYDKNGKRTGKSVNATFEFMGDDDVWVFIDDQLVLDLGGDHKDTTGIIDFADRKAYANDAIHIGEGGNKDNVEGHLSGQKVVNLQDVMVPGTFNENDTYNEDKVHTLRMFYMERGMYESDLLVRFNFSNINNNYLKVKEVTDFDSAGINKGLMELTQKAADYDVFNYKIANSGSTEEGDSGILSPTYNYYQRDNLGQKALLSGKNEYIPYIYLDISETLNGKKWNADNARMGAKLSGDGLADKIVVGEKVGDYLYRFDVSGGYTKVDFQRLATSSDTAWNTADIGTFEEGATYKITGWTSAAFDHSGSTTKYQENDFAPTQGDAVKNVNYNWTDEMASVISGTDTNRLVGTTDGNGTFRLMYGTDNKESSAEFLKQFKKGSTMTVNQLNGLKTVTRGTTPETFDSDLGRTVSEYYSTTVTVVDKGGNTILSGAMTDTNYAYQNTGNVDEKEPVQITETFVNTPKVGAITVTKQLNPNDNVTDEFEFTIRLYDVFGVKDMNVTNYPAVEATVNGKTVTLGTDGTFTLKRDETLTIQGVPYGTKYTVTEVIKADSNYKQEENGNSAATDQSVHEGTFDETHTNITPAAENQETVVNTRLTNSLTLSKELLGDDYSNTDVDENTPFKFEVTLSAPTGVDLEMYTFTTTPSDMIDNMDNKNSFTVWVSVNKPVTIDGIPYGTRYTVREITAKENWSNDGVKTGEIGENASAATIGNTYTQPEPEFGSLTVSKNVKNFTGTDEISDAYKALKFDFTVTLKDDTGTLLTGTVSYDITTVSGGTETKGTLDFVNGAATFQLSDDESVTIENILVGYQYTVAESSEMTGFEQIIPDNTQGIIEKGPTVVAFINQEIFTPYELPAAGFEDMRWTFVLLLLGMVSCGLAYWYVNREKVQKD